MSYFDERINLMKLQPKDYSLELSYTDQRFGYETRMLQPFLCPTKKGDIEIIPFTVEKKLIEFRKETNRKTVTHDGEGLSVYSVIRLAPENIKENGSKYIMPKGVETYPFITPEVIQFFEKKEQIKTLYLTEGALKAITAAKHLKLPFIGLGSITLYKDKLRELYSDIKKIIKTCQVNNVMMLYDGDTRNLSEKALKDTEKSLSDRPQSFFSSALNLRNFLVDEDVNFYFATIKSDTLQGNPKGIDDLILEHFSDLNEIISALKKKVSDKTYFHKIDLTGSLSKLKSYLNLTDVKTFWEYHRAKISYNSFKFFGTEYFYNFETDKLEIIKPEAANRYLRIGDDYYEKIDKPTIHGTINSILSRRMKSTIRDDHGKKIFKYIPKYLDFVLLPSHEDYQEIKNGFFNLYKPFTHEPEEGDFPNTEKYLRHIFSEQGDEGYQMGLDYIELMYKKPTQILPILCLISEENGTGKTMFAKYLNEIFKGNTIIVGNSEINSDFNGYLIGKLIVSIDESFLDKKLVIEKIKSLSTATTLAMTKKGKDTIEIEFFGKIILLSNNVDNFITANENDVRYWILNVPKVENDDPDLFEKIVKEIPAFIYFLQKRTMFTKNEHRAWFKPERLKTKSLQKIINKSKPQAQKEIETHIIEMFDSYQITPIQMSLSDIHLEIFQKKINKSYLLEICREKMKLDTKRGRYKYPISITDFDEIVFKNGNGSFYTFTPEFFKIDGTEFKNINDPLPF